MQYLTLTEIKKHLIIEHDEDDAQLVSMADAVEAYLPHVLGRPLSYYADEAGNIPADMRHAMLIDIADLYAHRESQTSYQLHDTEVRRRLLLHYVRY